MTDVALDATAGTDHNQGLKFQGSQRNMAVGIAMLVGGLLAFTMDMTHVYFARATAWTFVAWGALLLYSNLLDRYQTYEVRDDALVINNALRPWGAEKVWDWNHIYRLDVVVKRAEAGWDDAEFQVFWTPEGEIVKEREDREYHPELVRMIIEKAGLSPNGDVLEDFETLPTGKATYSWAA